MTEKPKVVTTSIDPEVWQIAKKEGIPWSRALEIGIMRIAKQEDMVTDRIKLLEAQHRELEAFVNKVAGRLCMLEEPVLMELRNKIRDSVDVPKFHKRGVGIQ